MKLSPYVIKTWGLVVTPIIFAAVVFLFIYNQEPPSAPPSANSKADAHEASDIPAIDEKHAHADFPQLDDAAAIGDLLPVHHLIFSKIPQIESKLTIDTSITLEEIHAALAPHFVGENAIDPALQQQLEETIYYQLVWMLSGDEQSYAWKQRNAYRFLNDQPYPKSAPSPALGSGKTYWDQLNALTTGPVQKSGLTTRPLRIIQGNPWEILDSTIMDQFDKEQDGWLNKNMMIVELTMVSKMTPTQRDPMLYRKSTYYFLNNPDNTIPSFYSLSTGHKKSMLPAMELVKLLNP